MNATAMEEAVTCGASKADLERLILANECFIRRFGEYEGDAPMASVLARDGQPAGARGWPGCRP